MMIMAYDHEGIILSHQVPPGVPVNAAYYASYLSHQLRPALRRKRPHLLQSGPILLHDNARCHTAHAVQSLLRRWGWEVLEHPPYSPDMSPCDFDLFPKMKEPLRGQRFRDIPSIVRALGRSLANLSQTGALNGIQRLPDIWRSVHQAGGDYIEGM